MTRRTRILTLLALAASVTPAGAMASVSRAPGPAAGSGAVPGEIIVRYKAAARSSARVDARRRAGVRGKRALGLSRAQLVEVQDGTSVGEAIERLRRSQAVAFAEPNRRVHLRATTPSDPYFGQDLLWGLDNGSGAAAIFGGREDSDIDAPEAWDVTTGSSAVTVAVVDTGVQYQHPDLQGQIWANTAETPGNGIDDDGNGFVDDHRGWDWVGAAGDNDPMDEQGHGTHVAGTIGATGDNGVGITGVSWDAGIMPLRVLDANGSGSVADVIDAFDYAGDNGAEVVNASLGSDGPTSAAEDAVIGEHPDVLFVFAAGNSGDDVDAVGSAPCDSARPNVICVAATDAADRLAGFSNFGATKVDLGAPGTQVFSTAIFQMPFTEDFESGIGSKWQNAGWELGVDSFGTYAFAANADESLTTAQPVDVTGKSGCALEFFALAGDVLSTSAARLQSAPTGAGPWSDELLVPNTDAWAFYELPVTGSRHYRFLLDYNGAGQARMRVDDIVVRCDGVDATTSYRFLSGTSMATPHVAGAAAVLLALEPGLAPSRARALLLDSGDTASSLSGKTVSGRRLNLMNALSAARPPSVATGAATEVTTAGAKLNGSVDPEGIGTDYFFEYGATTSYGSRTPVASAGAGSGPVTAGAVLSGLSPETTYHYRLVAVRPGPDTAGADATFTTAGAPPAPGATATPMPSASTPSPTPTPTPAPTATATPTPTPGPAPADPVELMKSTAKARCARPARRLRCRFSATGAERVRGKVRNRRGRVVGRFRGRAGKRIAFRVRGPRRGRYRVTLTFVDAHGNRARVVRRPRIR